MFQDNILHEPIYVQQLYTEYARLINKYHNVKRPSAFARYYNINKDSSTIDKTIESTYDHFHTNGIVYDLYDYTPLYYTAPVINDSMDSPDLVGKMFQGPLTVTTYTIREPQINDILVFPYNPTKGDEIFRVTNIRAVISAMEHQPEGSQVNWFELTLEYAPLEDTNVLNINNRYVYLLSEQRNVLSKHYVYLIKFIDKLVNLLSELQQYFNSKLEMYECNGFIPVEENRKLYNFLAVQNKDYHRYFEKTKKPFGVNHILYENQQYLYPDGTIIPDEEHNSLIFPIIYNVRSILDYNYPIDLYNMNNLLDMFFKYVESI